MKMKAAIVGARVSYDRGRHLTLLNMFVSGKAVECILLLAGGEAM